MAHAEVLDRSVAYQMTSSSYTQQHVTNIKDMRRSIIWELYRHPDMKVIRDEIIETEKSIISGMLRNPREVEATLLSHCKVPIGT